MIPYGHQSIDKKDIKSAVDVLKSDWLTQGPKILEFEKLLARYCGAKYAVVCSNGTAALHLAYLAARLNSGDEVITTPNTFAATANMLLAVGAKPVFCDIRLDTYNIDEKKIESLITAKTRAIVPVHFAGQACEMEKIKQIAQRHKLTVIEDACHALGAKYKNYKMGNCRYSDLAVFSFHPVKSITTGEGGAVLTNREGFYKKMLAYGNHGIHKDDQGKNVMTDLGYNYRLTDIQAALGISQLKKLDKFIKLRRQVVKAYEQGLAGCQEIILPKEAPGAYSGWHIYVILVKAADRRDALAAHLKREGIGVNFHYPAVYSHPYYRYNGFKDFSLTQEEIYHNSCLTLPCFPGLKQAEQKFVIKKIKEFF
ncbi:MAG: UDP-4-amino-4,6-dideoxy-N-acetyl-beta-L-altrosamine transaminase [bacterium]|nr:UDP-4-amino-4,6-dideoxy-N-acetyl-beta-L-altrosamine transaminase [bacterium]